MDPFNLMALTCVIAACCSLLSCVCVVGMFVWTIRREDALERTGAITRHPAGRDVPPPRE